MGGVSDARAVAAGVSGEGAGAVGAGSGPGVGRGPGEAAEVGAAELRLAFSRVVATWDLRWAVGMRMAESARLPDN